MTAHRIVIVGGGIAGINIATRLGRRLGRLGRATVTLVDRTPAHVWKPMLHAFAAGTAGYRNESLSFILHASRNGYGFVPGSLVGVDRVRQELQLGPVEMRDGTSQFGGSTLRYDTLILAIGSCTNDFGTPGVAEYCFSLDDIIRAERFHDAAVARAVNAITKDKNLTVGIVGGGATGVELAAELSTATDILAEYLPHRIRPRLQVTLIESSNRILNGLPKRVSAAAMAKLQDLSVAVELGAKVAAADAEGYVLGDGRRIDAALRVWTAGVAAPSVLADIEGLEVSQAGQLVVSPTLQSTRDPSIFAVGDCSSLPRPVGRRIPTTAQVARQQALFLAGSLARAIRFGRPLGSFRFTDFGSIVSLGGYTAFGTLGQHGLFPGNFIEGRVAQLGHAALYRAHQMNLNGLVRGGALILSDQLRRIARPGVRLD